MQEGVTIRVYDSLEEASRDFYPRKVRTHGSAAHRRPGALARTLKRVKPKELTEEAQHREDLAAAAEFFLRSLAYGEVVLARELRRALGMEKQQLCALRKKWKCCPIGIAEYSYPLGVVFQRVV